VGKMNITLSKDELEKIVREHLEEKFLKGGAKYTFNWKSENVEDESNPYEIELENCWLTLETNL
jgi:hypothetical protein